MNEPVGWAEEGPLWGTRLCWPPGALHSRELWSREASHLVPGHVVRKVVRDRIGTQIWLCSPWKGPACTLVSHLPFAPGPVGEVPNLEGTVLWPLGPGSERSRGGILCPDPLPSEYPAAPTGRGEGERKINGSQHFSSLTL